MIPREDGGNLARKRSLNVVITGAQGRKVGAWFPLSKESK